MINHEHKFIFIHIPKCGGTSIESIFEPNAHIKNVNGKHNGVTWRKHMTFKTHELLFPDLGNYFKFSIVRNPWDMTVSMYNYMWHSNHSWPNQWRLQLNDQQKNLSFKQWIKSPFFQTPTIRSADILLDGGKDGEFFDWVISSNWALDFILKFENLKNDFDIVCDKIGIPHQRLPHYNKTKHKHYTEYYDDETREIVARKYAKDIEYFGYKFGE